MRNPFEGETAELLTFDSKIVASTELKWSNNYKDGRIPFMEVMKELEKAEHSSPFYHLNKNNI